MGLYFVDRELLETVLATLQRVFPQVRAYRPLPSEVLFLASDQPIDVEFQVSRVIQKAAADLAAVGIFGPEDTAATLFLDEEGAAALAEDVRPNTDDDNRLAMRSPRILGGALGSAGADRILASRDPLLEDRGGLDRVAVVQTAPRRGSSGRAPSASRKRPVIRSRGRRRWATWRWRGANGSEQSRPSRGCSARDPSALRARAGLLRLQRRALLAGDPYAEALAAGLDAGGASVIEGWRRGAEGGGIELRTLEAELAKVSPRHPLYAEALRLRAAWRLESGESTQAAEALDLLDALIALEGSAEDLVSRARAAGLAGHPRIALVDLSDVADALEQSRSPRTERRDLAERPTPPCARSTSFPKTPPTARRARSCGADSGRSSRRDRSGCGAVRGHSRAVMRNAG